MGSPLSSASKRDEEAICVLLVVVVGHASGSLRGSGDKLGIAINTQTLKLQKCKIRFNNASHPNPHITYHVINLLQLHTIIFLWADYNLLFHLHNCIFFFNYGFRLITRNIVYLLQLFKTTIYTILSWCFNFVLVYDKIIKMIP